MKNQKGVVEFVLILIVAVVALSLIGFNLYKNGKILAPRTPEKHQPTVTPNPATTNWKIYENQEVGFNLSYPNNLFYLVIPNKHQDNITRLRFYDTASKAKFCSGQLEKYTTCSTEEIIGINIQIHQMQESLEKELDKFSLLSVPQHDLIFEFVGVSWTIFAGGTTSNAVGHTAWSVQNDKLIMLDFYQPRTDEINLNNYNPKDNDLANQILSTFQFIDESTDTANWKTYKNTKNGYSFKYPSDWGIGTVCDGDQEKDVVRIGEHLLKYPSQDCGTGNIPSPIMFFVDNEIPNYPNYRIVEQKTIPAGSNNIQYSELAKIDDTVGGSQQIFVFYILLDNGNYLISQTGAYPSNSRKSEFNDILSTLILLE